MGRRLWWTAARLLLLSMLGGVLACGDGVPPPGGGEAMEEGAPFPVDTPAAATPAPPPPPDSMVPAPGESVRRAAHRAMTLLGPPNLAGLARVVHPERGVLFSPYASVDPESVTLSSEELIALADSDPVRSWGYQDGSGEPIETTFAGYHGRFVYDGDFAAAPRVSVDERIGVGTTRDNIRDVVPDGVTVEYHLPGTDPQYGGMDWRSLRLVFVEEDARWWLVAVVHDQWTT